MGLSIHGSHPGYNVTQGSCPPIEIDSEAHSMHGTTGGCDGRGRGSVKPLVFDFLLPLFCFPFYCLVNGTNKYLLC